ncbi:MAG TPA: molybdenum cofactor guanylyltransferase [Nitrospira sp.]|nr:molybdenum cofactor guanylyltransferase [Nitrospira sp.]
MITDVTGILLAGGKSRRMGGDKRFLHVGEHTLFDRSLAVLRSIFRDVLIVIAQDSPPLETDAAVIRDLVPDCGSLGGLYTGLSQATTEHVFVVACDMPFLNQEAVRYVIGLKEEADIVMAEGENGLQPMHAVYSRRCLPVLEEMVRTHHLKIQDIVAHPSLKVRLINVAELSRIDPEGRSFLNVNTPADLEAARRLHRPPRDPHAH